MAHVHRYSAKHVPASWDYGPRTDHPLDPRNDDDTAECPVCDGNDAECECCHGSGYINADGTAFDPRQAERDREEHQAEQLYWRGQEQ
jgi:hypothetical protein